MRESQSIQLNNQLAKKAKRLIFSNKRYKEFTEEEKKIVDTYQSKILEIDGGVILPNTKADLDLKEIRVLNHQ